MANISYRICPSPISEIDLIYGRVKESCRKSLEGYIGQEWGRVTHAEMVDDIMHIYYQIPAPLHHINVTFNV